MLACSQHHSTSSISLFGLLLVSTNTNYLLRTTSTTTVKKRKSDSVIYSIISNKLKGRFIAIQWLVITIDIIEERGRL